MIYALMSGVSRSWAYDRWTHGLELLEVVTFQESTSPDLFIGANIDSVRPHQSCEKDAQEVDDRECAPCGQHLQNAEEEHCTKPSEFGE